MLASIAPLAPVTIDNTPTTCDHHVRETKLQQTSNLEEEVL